VTTLRGSYDFTLQCGADFALSMTYKEHGAPVDIRGWSATSEVRSKRNLAELLFSATVTLIDPQNGLFSWSVKAAQTIDLPDLPAVWDVALVAPSGGRVVVIGGNIKFILAVTRA